MQSLPPPVVLQSPSTYWPFSSTPNRIPEPDQNQPLTTKVSPSYWVITNLIFNFIPMLGNKSALLQPLKLHFLPDVQMNLVPPCKIRPLMKSFSSDVSETLPKNNAPFQNENWLPYQLTPSPYSDVCICSDLSTMRLLDFPSLHFPTRKSTLQIQAYNYEFNPRESGVDCWKLYRVFQIGRGGFLEKKLIASFTWKWKVLRWYIRWTYYLCNLLN